MLVISSVSAESAIHYDALVRANGIRELACRVVARCVGVARAGMSAFAKATARQSSLSTTLRAKTGGKGIRTPDLLIANETLYQLSYTPKEAEHDITPRQNFSNDSARLQFFTALVKPKTNYEIENLPFHRGDHSPPLFRANLGADRFA